MTKYTTLGQSTGEPKKTKFTHTFIAGDFMSHTSSQPENYDNVMYLFHDKEAGMDLFVAWNDNGARALYGGIKGDEFSAPDKK